jgi:hypothetical protein
MSPRYLTRLVFALLLAACGGGGGAEPGTGVEGIVSVGPQCPVETLDSPCPDLPFVGEVRATASDGNVTTVTTDAQGSFTMDLVPGSYTLVADTAGDGGPPTPIPQTVMVEQGSYTQVNLEVDSGIR